MPTVLWILAAALVLLAGVRYLRRLRGALGEEGVTDAMIARIEAHGHLELEEPLDLDEAAAEEERFWNEEPWDEPEAL